jgi:hypothetical protein
MVEATRIMPPQPSTVIAVLARQAAIKAVKHQMQRRGPRVTHFPLREIHIAADDYLRDHRDELIAQTWEFARGSPALWAMYEKEQRKRQQLRDRNSANLHNARRPDLQGHSPCSTYVQNGDRK